MNAKIAGLVSDLEAEKKTNDQQLRQKDLRINQLIANSSAVEGILEQKVTEVEEQNRRIKGEADKNVRQLNGKVKDLENQLENAKNIKQMVTFLA